MNTKQEQAIEEQLKEYLSLKDQIANLEQQIENIKSSVFGTLEKNGLETLRVGEDGAVIGVTIVRPSTLKIDEHALESALTKPQWKLVSKQVLDKKALEDAIVRGKIDIAIVTENSKEVASKPYLRITG